MNDLENELAWRGARIAALEAELQALNAAHLWIPLNERMPEGVNDVQLYCADTREQFVGFRARNGLYQFAQDRQGEGIVCRPTHWMPLPAAPQEDKDVTELEAELARWQNGSAILDQGLAHSQALIEEQAARVAELEAENRLLEQETFQPPSAGVVLPDLHSAVLDAFAAYERFGADCLFEGLPMIYASVLEELAEVARLTPDARRPARGQEP